MCFTAEGAPFEQGRAQGSEWRDAIVRRVHDLHDRYDPWSLWHTRNRIRRGPERMRSCFLPQQHERIEGIARGAGVSRTALELLETNERIELLADVCGERIEAAFEAPPEIEAALILRRSKPDAGGMPSVELSAAHWTGVLAGVNAEGITVVCLCQRGWALSLRVLAGDLLLRARSLHPGIEHLRRRAEYAGGSGKLLVADASGEAITLELGAGRLSLQPVSGRFPAAMDPRLRIDPAARALRWRSGSGRLLEAALS